MGALRKTADRLRARDDGAAVLAWTFTWYSCAIMCVVTSKIFVQWHPNCVWTLSCSQFLFANLWSHVWMGCKPPQAGSKPISRAQALLIFGEAAACVLGFFCTNSAFHYMNANLVETIKATEPVPAVVFSRVLAGEKWPHFVEVASLSVIVVGVMLASYNDAALNLAGMVATICANVWMALANNISKVAVARDDNIDPAIFWYRTVQTATIITLPMALSEHMHRDDFVPGAQLSIYRDLPLLLLNSATFFMYNQATCAILEYIRMSTHAVLNSVRRAVLIVSTTLYFASPISAMNVLGVGVAASGFVTFLHHKSKPRVHESTSKQVIAACPTDAPETGSSGDDSEDLLPYCNEPSMAERSWAPAPSTVVSRWQRPSVP